MKPCHLEISASASLHRHRYSNTIIVFYKVSNCRLETCDFVKNILKRYLAENFPIIEKELPRKTHVGNTLWGIPFQ